MDLRILQLISDNHTPFLDSLAIFIHRSTETGLLYLPFIAYFLLASDIPRRYIARLMFATGVLTYLINDLILKNIFQRHRPSEIFTDLNLIPPFPVSYSMPSGQAAVAFGIAIIWYLAYPKHWSRYVGILFAILVALDRIYMGHHYPSDVLVGALTGGIIAYLLFTNRHKIKILHYTPPTIWRKLA